MKTFNISFGLVVVTTFLIGSCNNDTKQNPPCAANTKCFKIERFNEELKKRLDNNCVGYGYAIGYKETVQAFNSGGQERTAADLPVKPFSVFDPMNPASLCKTITATALLQVLNKKGISEKEFIYKYFPPDWTLGPNMKTITFYEILKHTSGLRKNGWGTYPVLRGICNAGISLPNKIYLYDNVNYEMMRILIPRLDDAVIVPATDDNLSVQYGRAYVDYCNRNLFNPISISKRDVKPDAENQNLCYVFPYFNSKGEDYGDWTTTCGQAGWNISVTQLSSLIRNMKYSTKLIPAATEKLMESDLLGFDGKGTTPVLGVSFVNKNGGFPGPPNNKGAFNGEIYLFGNDVTLVLYINSDLKYPGGMNQLIIDAFDASI